MMSRTSIRLTVSTILVLIATLAGCGGDPPPVETGWTSSDDLSILMDKVTRTLSNVLNVDSAQARLPALESVSDKFDSLIDKVPNLNPSDRQKIREQAAKAMPGLKGNTRRIHNMQGVDEILGPIMNELVGKLGNLTE